ncbi:MAG: endonuclease/exonuclease/phosphatase family protein [Defluviitaleaceae bacterium]|nr:endonuclease/exonuclease/phosphatase family protein [Defluviitaleaceae bacterium]
MKIMTWNIKGLYPKTNPENIAKQVLECEADIIVLTEAGRSRMRGPILDTLEKNNYECHLPMGRVKNGHKKGEVCKLGDIPCTIIIAIKKSCGWKGTPIELSDKQKNDKSFFVNRWLYINLKKSDEKKIINLLGVYIPGVSKNGAANTVFWNNIFEEFVDKIKNDDAAIIIGDFNGYLSVDDIEKKDMRSKKLVDTDMLKLYNKMNWVDAWGERGNNYNRFTWRSRAKNGFRLDYAFLSPCLAKDSKYTVQHLDIDSTLSDHIPLVIDEIFNM